MAHCQKLTSRCHLFHVVYLCSAAASVLDRSPSIRNWISLHLNTPCCAIERVLDVPLPVQVIRIEMELLFPILLITTLSDCMQFLVSGCTIRKSLYHSFPRRTGCDDTPMNTCVQLERNFKHGRLPVCVLLALSNKKLWHNCGPTAMQLASYSCIADRTIQ